MRRYRTNMKILSPFRFLPLGAAALALFACNGAKPPAPASSRPRPLVAGTADLSRPDLLPRLGRSVEAGMVSSYDRGGGNDDGFSGKYSFIRKEPGGLVLADLEGPGVVTRIHTPTPTDDVVEFYFDGEAAPRIRRKVAELFDGTRAPFLPPLVGAGAGGRYCYVPIPFRRSCKIVVKAETFCFYDIDYSRFPEDAAITTYQEQPSAGFQRWLEEAGRLLGRAGTDISDALLPEGARLEKTTVRGALPPGGTLKLFGASGPGRVVGLRIGPAAAFAGKERDIVLRMFWDGGKEPAVECPVGDFFGYSFGRPATRSLFLGTADGTDYAYLPMPFARSARIELVSERTSGPAVQVEAEIAWARAGKEADEGRFYARWNRENPTREGTPYTFLKTMGKGRVVGVILQAQGLEPGATPFFEGDDRAVIDGRLAIPGTGSEDSFNGGWYDVPARWESRLSFPLSGCLDYKKPLGRTGGYRWFVADAYAYDKSIDFTIEHGPEGNLVPTDYASVTFFYALEPPPAAPPLAPAAARAVVDPETIVFVPGWNVPIHTFSLRNAVLEKKSEKIGDAGARFLSVRTSGEEVFGPHHVSFVCDLPAAGRYRLMIKAVAGPDQGIVRLFRNDMPAGEAVDFYAPSRSLGDRKTLGEFDMAEGDNLVFLHLVGKNRLARGMNMDLVEIVFEKVH
jgi:hypothetical protein